MERSKLTGHVTKTPSPSLAAIQFVRTVCSSATTALYGDMSSPAAQSALNFSVQKVSHPSDTSSAASFIQEWTSQVPIVTHVCSLQLYRDSLRLADYISQKVGLPILCQHHS